MAKYYHDAYYQNKASFFSKRTMIFLGIGVGVALVISIILLVLGGGGSAKDDLTRLTVRYANLSKFVTSPKDRIRDAELRKFNSDTILLISSDAATFASALQTNHKGTKPSKDLAKLEADTTSELMLKNAALLDKFDAAYKQLLAAKLINTEQLVQKVGSETKSKLVRTAAQKAQTNIDQIQARLKDLN